MSPVRCTVESGREECEVLIPSLRSRNTAHKFHAAVAMRQHSLNAVERERRKVETIFTNQSHLCTTHGRILSRFSCSDLRISKISQTVRSMLLWLPEVCIIYPATSSSNSCFLRVQNVESHLKQLQYSLGAIVAHTHWGIVTECWDGHTFRRMAIAEDPTTPEDQE